jgi:hypothetical protein
LIIQSIKPSVDVLELALMIFNLGFKLLEFGVVYALIIVMSGSGEI